MSRFWKYHQFCWYDRIVYRQVNLRQQKLPPKQPAADAARAAGRRRTPRTWPSLDGKMQWAPDAALLWVSVPPLEGEVRGYTIQDGCTRGPGQVAPLVVRRLYLSFSSRVTLLVIRPHIRPIRNNMQMLPLITDRM